MTSLTSHKIGRKKYVIITFTADKYHKLVLFVKKVFWNILKIFTTKNEESPATTRCRPNLTLSAIYFLPTGEWRIKIFLGRNI